MRTNHCEHKRSQMQLGSFSMTEATNLLYLGLKPSLTSVAKVAPLLQVCCIQIGRMGRAACGKQFVSANKLQGQMESARFFSASWLKPLLRWFRSKRIGN